MRSLLTLAALMIAGCSSAPETRYYLLPEATPSVNAAYTGGTVALRELDLPLYARASQVAQIGPDGAVALSDDHRWADEPQRASTRALAGALRAALNVPVVVEPWSRAVEPIVRIDVSVDRFIGKLGGTLTLSGEFQIVTLESRSVTSADSFTIEEPVRGEGFEDLTAAHSRALARLADQIVASMGGQAES